jgi:colanic acid biosynthesis glycosyl transferase WcaI
MRKERILLLGGNFFPEPTGIGKYNGEMVEWMSNNGYDVTVVTTFPYYPHWKVQEPYTKSRYWFKKEKKVFANENSPVTVIRCPHYVPSNPSGGKRMISDFSIVFATFLVVLRLLFSSKYQYVMTVAPPFQTGLLAIMYKRLRNAKILYHIQDLQIDAAHELGMIKSKRLIKLLFGIEKFILRNTDHVSSISSGMINRIKSKLDKDVLFLPNWVETGKFFPILDKKSIKASFGFNENDKIVLYSGAIGQKQGLESILQTAQSLKENTDIKFVICGAGPYKANLVRMQESMQLDNVVFLPLQPHEKFNDFLNMADLHLVLQKAGASDLVMPSKLSSILSVGGVALVTAEQGTGLHSYVSSNKIGILIEPENQEVLTNSIYEALFSDQKHIQVNARNYAEKYLAIDNILSSYMSEIKGSTESVASHSTSPIVSYAN